MFSNNHKTQYQLNTLLRSQPFALILLIILLLFNQILKASGSDISNREFNDISITNKAQMQVLNDQQNHTTGIIQQNNKADQDNQIIIVQQLPNQQSNQQPNLLLSKSLQPPLQHSQSLPQFKKASQIKTHALTFSTQPTLNPFAIQIIQHICNDNKVIIPIVNLATMILTHKKTNTENTFMQLINNDITQYPIQSYIEKIPEIQIYITNGMLYKENFNAAITDQSIKFYKNTNAKFSNINDETVELKFDNINNPDQFFIVGKKEEHPHALLLSQTQATLQNKIPFWIRFYRKIKESIFPISIGLASINTIVSSLQSIKSIKMQYAPQVLIWINTIGNIFSTMKEKFTLKESENSLLNKYLMDSFYIFKNVSENVQVNFQNIMFNQEFLQKNSIDITKVFSQIITCPKDLLFSKLVYPTIQNLFKINSELNHEKILGNNEFNKYMMLMFSNVISEYNKIININKDTRNSVIQQFIGVSDGNLNSTIEKLILSLGSTKYHANSWYYVTKVPTAFSYVALICYNIIPLLSMNLNSDMSQDDVGKLNEQISNANLACMVIQAISHTCNTIVTSAEHKCLEESRKASYEHFFKSVLIYMLGFIQGIDDAFNTYKNDIGTK